MKTGSPAAVARSPTRPPAICRWRWSANFRGEAACRDHDSVGNGANEAQRQQLYLDRVVQPNLPDYPTSRDVSATRDSTCLGLLTWTIVSLLVAAVREHLE